MLLTNPISRFALVAVTTLSVVACAAEKPAVQPSSETPVTAVTPVQADQPEMDGDLAGRLTKLEQNMGGLESDVANLQTEMTQARPRLAKVETMERHFRQLSLELDRINQTYDVGATPEPVKAEPAPTSAAQSKSEPAKAEAKKPTPKKTQVKPAEKAASGALKVNQIRVGEQPGGKTRIVLDSNVPAKINYDIDNAEKILVIEIPGAAWGAAQTGALKSSPLVASYQAEGDASGSRLIVQLKQDAQVVGTSRLNPAKGAGHRVFLDLGKK